MPCSSQTFSAASMPVQPSQLSKARSAPVGVGFQDASVMVTKVRAPSSIGSNSNVVVVPESSVVASPPHSDHDPFVRDRFDDRHRERPREVVEIPRRHGARLSRPRRAAGGEVLRQLRRVGDRFVHLPTWPADPAGHGEMQFGEWLVD